MPPEVADKTRQKHPFASPTWVESYKRRTAVERGFAYIKDRAREDGSRGRIRVMRRAKVHLLRTAMYMSVNDRLLERFEADALAPPGPRQRARRRGSGEPRAA